MSGYESSRMRTNSSFPKPSVGNISPGSPHYFVCPFVVCPFVVWLFVVWRLAVRDNGAFLFVIFSLLL